MPAKFESIVRRFDHLKKLGVNCLVQLPVAEFAGDRSWGYNPAHIFAVESSYGGPKAFKQFIREGHRNVVRGDPRCGLQPLWGRVTSTSGDSTAGARTTAVASISPGLA